MIVAFDRAATQTVGFDLTCCMRVLFRFWTQDRRLTGQRTDSFKKLLPIKCKKASRANMNSDLKNTFDYQAA